MKPAYRLDTADAQRLVHLGTYCLVSDSTWRLTGGKYFNASKLPW